jgi:hypothetical protein
MGRRHRGSEPILSDRAWVCSVVRTLRVRGSVTRSVTATLPISQWQCSPHAPRAGERHAERDGYTPESRSGSVVRTLRVRGGVTRSVTATLPISQWQCSPHAARAGGPHAERDGYTPDLAR